MKRLGIGIDPASFSIGVALVSVDAGQPQPISGGYTLLHRAIKDTERRIKQLEEDYWHQFYAHLSHMIGDDEFRIEFVSIEYPIDSFGSDRHEIKFVLGMAYWMLWNTNYCEFVKEHNPPVPIYRVLPAESSVAVGCRRGASKESRNIAVCREVGGYYAHPPQKSKEGTCHGGALDGANPDVLDAYAAAIAGWGKWHEQSLARKAKEKDRHHGVPTVRLRKSV